MTGNALAERIAYLALEKKGKDITILDLRGLSDITDFFVIVTCESDIQVKTIASHVEKELRNEKIRVLHKEGFNKSNWVLLDYIEVVLHIFREETREYYALERLWADAKMTKVEDDAGIRVVSENSN